MELGVLCFSMSFSLTFVVWLCFDYVLVLYSSPIQGGYDLVIFLINEIIRCLCFKKKRK